MDYDQAVTNESCVMSHVDGEEQRARWSLSWSTPIAHAKLKQSQLSERDGIIDTVVYNIYDGIDDALQNQSCPMN